MHVTLLTDGLFPYVVGGMQRHSRALAEHMALAGARVTVFHTAYSQEHIKSAEACEGLSAVPWNDIETCFVRSPPAGRYPGHYVPDCRTYSRLLLSAFVERGICSDFIYAQGLTGLAFVDAKSRGRSLPPIGINAHGYQMFQPAAGVAGWIEYLLLRHIFARLSRQADYVFTFGRHVRAIAERRLGVPETRILEIPNAVDESWFVDSPRPSSSKRRFVFVGRYNRLKGIGRLFSAIQRIPAAQAEFHFAGPIPPRVQLRRPNIVYHGAVESTAQLKAILDAADVLVCPSFAEGMPTVILEAMARGLAVIATDVGASGELVSDDNGVLLSSPRVSLIAQAIEKLAGMSNDSLDACKRASLQWVQAYGWRRVARQTLGEIERVIASCDAAHRDTL
jgi:glycosyltransferase involved in cell wall biosynthesis